MNGVEINFWGVLAAMVASMIVGSIWYSQGVFGKTWMKLANVKPSENSAFKPMAFMVVCSFLTAYVLAHVAYLSNQYFGNSFLKDSLQTAFWAWLGFTAARVVTHDAFENRPMKLTAITIAHELATFLAMGAAIGYVGI